MGNIAADLVSAVLSRFSNVVQVPESRDIGIDFYCELMDEKGYPTGRCFNVQCKGTSEIDWVVDGFSVPVKVSTANYWLIQPAPTFLILVDIGFRKFYWAYPRQQLTRDASWEKQKTVSILVRKRDRFGFEATSMPQEMKALLDRHLPAEIETLIKQFDQFRPEVPLDDPEHFHGPVSELMAIADATDAFYRLQKVTKDATARLQEETLKVAAQLRRKSTELLAKLDHTPGSAGLWQKGGSIFAFEFCSGRTADIWDRVDKTSARFQEQRTRENHSEVLAALSDLIQLNRDIYWTIEASGDGL